MLLDKDHKPYVHACLGNNQIFSNTKKIHVRVTAANAQGKPLEECEVSFPQLRKDGKVIRFKLDKWTYRKFVLARDVMHPNFGELCRLKVKFSWKENGSRKRKQRVIIYQG